MSRPLAVLNHAIAGLVSAGVLTAIPIVVYIASAVVSNDAGGPLSLVMVPLLSLAVGAGTTLFVCLPCAILFVWLCRRTRMPVWLPPLAFFLLAALGVVVWGTLALDGPPPIGYLGLGASGGGFFTIGFIAYWFVLMFGRRLLERHTASTWDREGRIER
jgi:hypothetical protein